MKKLVVVAALLAAAGCTEKKEPPKAKPPVPVSVAQAAVKTVPVKLTAVGTVEASETVSVKAQISGELVKVHFREGQEIGKGAVLFSIDSRPLNASLKQAEANLARNLAQAKNAKEQADRYATLLKDGIVTQDQYDTYRTNAEALAAAANADRAAVENAKVQLSYCTVRSPISGRTGNLMVHQGNLVKANDVALVTINRLSPVDVAFSISEKQLPEVRQRMAAGGLKVEAYPEEGKEPETGTISFLDNAVDPATGMIKLKATFPNGKKRLWAGQFVNVVVTLATLKDAVTVPSSAIQTGQQGQFVFIAKEDGSAEIRPVVPGVASGADTVVLKGIAAGETVVTDGQMRIFPGAKLMVKKPDAKPAQGKKEQR